MINKQIICLSFLLFISACGGGGNTISNNEPPIAVITTAKLIVKEGDTIDFNSLNSRDPEGDNLKYHWKFVFEGHETEKNTHRSFYQVPEVSEIGGTLDAILTVTDSKNNTGTSKVTIDVQNIEVSSNTLSLLEKCSFLKSNKPSWYAKSGSRVSGTPRLDCSFDGQINLSEPELVEITKFHNLYSLTFTNTNNSNVTNMDTITDLSTLPRLKILTLNRVNVVDSSIGLLKDLSTLRLFNTKIIHNLNELPSLTRMELGNISLDSPLKLTSLDKLTYLSMKKINNFDSIELPESLEYLEMSNFSSSVTPISIQNQYNLKTLKLFNTNLSSSFDFLNLINLKHLTIHEPIDSLNLSRLTGLIWLKFSNTNFTVLPDISNLNNLDTLAINNNKPIERLSMTSNLTNLKFLYFGSHLEEFPDISKLEKLEEGSFVYFKTMDLSPLLQPSSVVNPPRLYLSITCNDDILTRYDIPNWFIIPQDPFVYVNYEDCL